jgi:hypothetical protein
MAVSGYQNPLEYQMYSAFENKEEDAAPVTTTNVTETQPVTTTAQPQLPRSSLDILQSAGVQPTQRAASEILKGVGVTSAKDVLRSMYVEKPEGLLEAEGISAASILEDYRKEQAAFRQRQQITDYIFAGKYMRGWELISLTEHSTQPQGLRLPTPLRDGERRLLHS